MTTIVGIQGNGWSVVAGDSRAYADRHYNLVGSGKIGTVDGMVIATCGDMRGANLLLSGFKTPTINTSDLDRWVTLTLIPAISECFEKNGYERKEDAYRSSETQFLISVKGKIYEIGENYDWVRDSGGLYGLGTGGQFALGYLAAQEIGSLADAIKYAELAVLTAGRYDPYTSAPVTVLTQKQTRSKAQ